VGEFCHDAQCGDLVAQPRRVNRRRLWVSDLIRLSALGSTLG
jgi:hypothetical protein